MSALDLEAVGTRVRKLRNAKRQSQVDFAKEIQIGRQIISGVEGGRLNLTIENAIKLCKTCQVTLDWIYFGKSSSSVSERVIEELS